MPPLLPLPPKTPFDQTQRSKPSTTSTSVLDVKITPIHLTKEPARGPGPLVDQLSGFHLLLERQSGNLLRTKTPQYEEAKARMAPIDAEGIKNEEYGAFSGTLASGIGVVECNQLFAVRMLGSRIQPECF